MKMEINSIDINNYRMLDEFGDLNICWNNMKKTNLLHRRPK
ncbi:hypothetical protein XNW1_2390019 [Xenorhabdus nematophila str. Websteri]|nr:hypothetical protein XNW1_2390019 [Xenorhabdus nematophila str. Websteri]